MKKKDTTIVEKISDGTIMNISAKDNMSIKDETDWLAVENMTEEDIEKAALSDPDNLPLTDDELKKFRSVPNLKEIRLRLHMTQEQFANSFHVPIGTLRDWEQGAKYPDSAARSYLRVIDKAPYMVIQALEN
ncbi:MAG: hypothetical protein R3D71_07090 [Rickettsiales bacterium]